MEQKTLKNRTIFCRDNLEVLRGIDSDTIDLVYLDPPFNKKKVFTAPIGTSAEGASFQDIFREEDMKEEWLGLIADEKPALYNYIKGIADIGHLSNKNYLVYMAVRLIELHRVLKDTGSLYLHCDPTMSHLLKLLLDCIFGEGNFRNEVIWNYRRWPSKQQDFQKMHDVLLRYTKSSDLVWNQLFEELSDSTLKRFKGKKIISAHDEFGKRKPSLVNTEEESQKLPMRDVWAIPIIAPVSKERTGYPTQKPLALLTRIIQASSNEGDVVLDPFCGCATTCIAAEKLGRQWVGIDISKRAYELVKVRLQQEVAHPERLFEYDKKIIYREDILERTDIEKVKNYRQHKHLLFGKQEGKCMGCHTLFEFRHLEVDHIVPRSQGGGNALENLQLICGSCNRIKGDRDMTYLRRRLKELKIIE